MPPKRAQDKKKGKAAAQAEHKNAADSKRSEREQRIKARNARMKERWSVPAKELADFGRQIEPLGLVLRDVKGDGNCLFRALSDQLYGDESHHVELRAATVEYIRAHRDDFEPFRESEKEDETFDEYVDAMAQDGFYVGNWALVAFSRLHNVSIAIHQLGQPVWYMHPDGVAKRTLHVAYFGFEHYSSVRDMNQDDGPANVVVRPPLSSIGLSSSKANQVNAAAAAATAGGSSSSATAAAAPKRPTRVMSKQQQRAARKAAAAVAASNTDEAGLSWNERVLRDSTGITDMARIRETLLDCGGDVNKALDRLFQEEEALAALQAAHDAADAEDDEAIATAIALSSLDVDDD